MYVKTDVSQVRRNITQHVGSKVMLETNKGRQKSLMHSGTIENAYPSIFTILLDAADAAAPKRTVSYSYTDVLTKSVEITVFSS